MGFVPYQIPPVPDHIQLSDEQLERYKRLNEAMFYKAFKAMPFTPIEPPLKTPHFSLHRHPTPSHFNPYVPGEQAMSVTYCKFVIVYPSKVPTLHFHLFLSDGSCSQSLTTHLEQAYTAATYSEAKALLDGVVLSIDYRKENHNPPKIQQINEIVYRDFA